MQVKKNREQNPLRPRYGNAPRHGIESRRPRVRRPDKRLRAIKRPTLPIGFTGRIWIYPLMLLASLIFAQALKLPLSHMLFVFVLLLPLVSVLQLTLAALFIRTSARIENNLIEKRTPVSFAVIASNECLMPFPFIEAELMVPDRRGAKCVPKRVGFSLTPFSGCEIGYSATFHFRGVYSPGLKQLWVYDFFRMVKLRLIRDNYAPVFVLPKRYELPPRPIVSESERSTQSVLRLHGSDNTELSDMRAYVPGDHPKSIHWKLSSKSQDLIVKDYSKNTGKSIYILCDLEPHYADLATQSDAPAEKPGYMGLQPPIPEYADIIDQLNSDLVVEHCLAAALRELRVSNSVTLLWLTKEDGRLVPNSRRFSGIPDFDAAFREFAVAPEVDCPKQLTLLAGMIPDEEKSSLILVSSRLDASAAADYLSIAAAYRKTDAKTVELLCCRDRSLYEQDASYETAFAELVAGLGAHLTVTIDESSSGTH